jgi:hypothetical protein
MNKISSCPVCEMFIEQDTEQCLNCRWILTSYSLLDREKYNRLVDWAIDCYKELNEEKSKNDYKQNVLKSRLDKHRDNIDSLQKQIDELRSNDNYIKSTVGYVPTSQKNEINFIDNQINDIFPHIPEINSSLINSPIQIDFNLPVLLVANDLAGISSDLSTQVSGELIDYHDNSNDLNSFEIIYDQLDTSLDNFKNKYGSNPLDWDNADWEHFYLIEDYLNNINDFNKRYPLMIATFTKETTNNNKWTNELLVAEADRGNYLVCECENFGLLFPNHNQYFNQHNYQTLSIIFECENYTSDYQSIKLLLAAMVINESNISPKTWRLKKQGKLVFM